MSPATLGFARPVEAVFSTPSSWTGELLIGSLGGLAREGLMRGRFDSARRELGVDIRQLVCEPNESSPNLDAACLGEAIALFAVSRARPCAGVTCGDAESPCDPRASTCRADGASVCNDEAECTPRAVPSTFEGWDDAPGAGQVFVVDRLGLAAPSRGFDIDGSCRGPGDCVENVLGTLGHWVNDAIQQAVLGGESIVLIELAGIEEPFRGNDSAVAFKLYRGRDADDPAFPADNFSTPAGETTCCNFSIQADSVTGLPPQARTRSVARIERGQLSSSTPSAGEIDVAFGTPVPGASPLRLERLIFRGHTPANLENISEGLIGAAVPASALGRMDKPFCSTASDLCQEPGGSTLLDYLSSKVRLDIDLDGDGLERFEIGANGRVAVCRDGCGADICPIVPPLVATEPWTCALDPRMADGFSVAFEVHAVRASVDGIAPEPN